jgi:hypothetical protein
MAEKLDPKEIVDFKELLEEIKRVKAKMIKVKT